MINTRVSQQITRAYCCRPVLRMYKKIPRLDLIEMPRSLTVCFKIDSQWRGASLVTPAVEKGKKCFLLLCCWSVCLGNDAYTLVPLISILSYPFAVMQSSIALVKLYFSRNPRSDSVNTDSSSLIYHKID